MASNRWLSASGRRAANRSRSCSFGGSTLRKTRSALIAFSGAWWANTQRREVHLFVFGDPFRHLQVFLRPPQPPIGNRGGVTLHVRALDLRGARRVPPQVLPPDRQVTPRRRRRCRSAPAHRGAASIRGLRRRADARCAEERPGGRCRSRVRPHLVQLSRTPRPSSRHTAQRHEQRPRQPSRRGRARCIGPSHR